MVELFSTIYHTMTQLIPSTTFRESFRVVSKELIQWYPGHMNKSLQVMQQKIRQVDCILEVHDARLPFSGRNPNFVKNLIGAKPHILILNKKDLIPKKEIRVIGGKLEEQNLNVIFTNSLDQCCRGLKEVTKTSADLISKSDRFYRFEDPHYRIMVIGVPNVGKSSLINGLRNRNLHRGKANAVGALAGVTKAVQNEVRISNEPLMYLVDTPGILPPNIEGLETGMKLALCSCLNDCNVGIVTIADYMLYWLNKHQHFKYVDVFNLVEPSDEIMPILMKIAVDCNKFLKQRSVINYSVETVPDVQYAAQQMVKLFRKGALGRVVLDRDFCV